MLNLNSERIVHFNRLNERRHDLNDVFNVVEIGHFHNGMHVAKWQGNESAWDAASNMIDRIGVRSCEAGGCLVLQ